MTRINDSFAPPKQLKNMLVTHTDLVGDVVSSNPMSPKLKVLSF